MLLLLQKCEQTEKTRQWTKIEILLEQLMQTENYVFDFCKFVINFDSCLTLRVESFFNLFNLKISQKSNYKAFLLYPSQSIP